jgi:hypothetical protein
MAERNGTGQGGKSFQDRELAARVRTLALNEIEQILLINGLSTPSKKKPAGKKNKKLYETVIANLSKSILPRLTEHTGENGGPIEITGVTIKVRK